MKSSKICAFPALIFSLASVFPLWGAEHGDSSQDPAPAFEGLFHDGAVLMNSPHQLDETFSTRHRREGFLQDDLRDFIAWLGQNTISPNPALMSLAERRAFLLGYMTFMEGPAYLAWLGDRPVPESLVEEWLKVWRGLGIHEQNLFHERAMAAKKAHLDRGGAPLIFVQRNEHLFGMDAAGKRVPLRAQAVVSAPLGAPDSLVEHRHTWFFESGNLIKDKLAVIMLGCAGFFLLTSLVWKALRSFRKS